MEGLAQQQKQRRHKLIRAIHTAARPIFWSIGHVSNEGVIAYRDWLRENFGIYSCSEVETNDGLQEILDALNGKPRAQRLSVAQEKKIYALTRELKWEGGLDDVRLNAFCLRMSIKNSTRQLTMKEATSVISGLEKWIASMSRSRITQ